MTVDEVNRRTTRSSRHLTQDSDRSASTSIGSCRSMTPTRRSTPGKKNTIPSGHTARLDIELQTSSSNRASRKRPQQHDQNHTIILAGNGPTTGSRTNNGKTNLYIGRIRGVGQFVLVWIMTSSLPNNSDLVLGTVIRRMTLAVIPVRILIRC
jgi:hypothetical protein